MYPDSLAGFFFLGAICFCGATLVAAEGEPVAIVLVVCMHREHVGVLFYRRGYREARRAWWLDVDVCSPIVKYENLYQIALARDGTIDIDVRLTVQPSTNLVSAT